jgi:large subunit ribosomal protein L14
MIQPRSLVVIADNSGAKIGRIFKVLGSAKKRYAQIGELVTLSVQVAEPRKQVKKKDVLRAVVVRQRKPFRRKDGSYIRFDENAVVIIEGAGKNAKEPRRQAASLARSHASSRSLATRPLFLARLRLYKRMNTLHIKKGDTVTIIAGNDKGKSGKVTKTFPKTQHGGC